MGDAGRKKTEDELDAQAELVRRLRTVAQKHGVVLNLHNHIYEVKDNEYDLRGTLARIPDAKLGPDLDWLTGAGVNPADFIRRYSGRIVYMHIRIARRMENGRKRSAKGQSITRRFERPWTRFPTREMWPSSSPIRRGFSLPGRCAKAGR